MRKGNFLWIALVAMAAFTSCHTTEANYKAAYDKAVEKTKEGMGLDVYNRVLEESRRNTYVINGDSLRLIPEHANIVDGKPEEVKRYNVIAAEFTQRFNALSYRDRLRKEDHRPAYVLWQATDQKYLVVTEGFDDAAQAAELVKNYRRKVKLKALVPKVWVLQKI